MNTVKEASKRIAKAETILYRVGEMLEAAQREISVVYGLNQNHPKIGNIRQKIKEQMYDLERCRESGLVELDETATALLMRKKAGNLK